MQQKQFLEGSSQWYSFPLKRQEKSQIKKPNLGSLKELEKEEQIKPKVRRRKEIIKVREEINKMEIKKNRKISKTNSWFFERVNKIDKNLWPHSLWKRENPRKQNETGDIKTDTGEIQRNLRKYCE